MTVYFFNFFRYFVCYVILNFFTIYYYIFKFCNWPANISARRYRERELYITYILNDGDYRTSYIKFFSTITNRFVIKISNVYVSKIVFFLNQPVTGGQRSLLLTYTLSTVLGNVMSVQVPVSASLRVIFQLSKWMRQTYPA